MHWKDAKAHLRLIHAHSAPHLNKGIIPLDLQVHGQAGAHTVKLDGSAKVNKHSSGCLTRLQQACYRIVMPFFAVVTLAS